MKYIQSHIKGVVVIDLEKRGDERGFFARTFDVAEFEQHGLPTRFVQANVSLSAQAGTLRGLHFQAGEHAEDKLVRCTRGSLFDVAADMRPDSPTFGQWFGVELTADSHRALLVPKGCAHGFITLTQQTEAFYLVSSMYAPQSEGGIRFNDPLFKIEWPTEVTVISEKDAAWPDFSTRVK